MCQIYYGRGLTWFKMTADSCLVQWQPLFTVGGEDAFRPKHFLHKWWKQSALDMTLFCINLAFHYRKCLILNQMKDKHAGQ